MKIDKGIIKEIIQLFVNIIIGVNRWIIFLFKFIGSKKDNVINAFESALLTIDRIFHFQLSLSIMYFLKCTIFPYIFLYLF
jgi:hypothetical protein